MLWILAQTIILQLAFSFKVSWFCFCSVEVGKKTSSKKNRVQNWPVSDFLMSFFVY